MIQEKAKHLFNSFLIPGVIVLVLWAIHGLQWLSGIKLSTWGVLPRDGDGVFGIIFMPLLHGDWGHLLSNTPPLFVLSAITFYFYRKVAVPAFLMIYGLTGVAVWLFARGFTFHIGASGVIYGLVAFIFWSGIFRRNIKSIALALIVAFYYGSMAMGILPGQEGISWEGHLFGALVGIFTAYWFKEKIEKDEDRPTYSWEKEKELPEAPFLNPDTFERTKDERQKENLWRRF